MPSIKHQDAVGRRPTTLYIIGNGFDLWHDIASGYENFKAYVKQHDREIFEAVEDYLPAGEDWSSLESALAEIDVDNIVENLGHFMASYGDNEWSDSGHHDFQYEVKKVVGRLSTQLTVLFGEWVRTLSIPKPDTAKAMLKLVDAEAAFLTFNYTPTLQELYAVPDYHVLHIHGEATMPDDELILGHAWDPANRKSLNDRSDIEEVDTRLTQVHDILDSYFSKTFKPSGKLIIENEAFFDQLNTIDTVHVLGHSLSDVDVAYLKALLKVPAIAAARWHVACRKENERSQKFERLIELGVDPSNAVTHLWTYYS